VQCSQNLLDNLVGDRRHVATHGEAKRRSRRQIDHELEFVDWTTTT
jgi:hypothetical protein